MGQRSDLDFLNRLGPVFLDSYFVVDRQRRVSHFNEAFVQLLGYRPAQRRKINNTPCYEMLKLEICRERCIALDCLAKDAPVRMEEIRGKTPDGRDIVVELSAVPMRSGTGEIEGVFVTHRDVTDERRLKSRYREEQKENRTKLDELTRLLNEKESELQALKNSAK